MIKVGDYNELTILREKSVGLFLGDESGEEVLLPNKYCPDEFEIGETIWVFVYRDHEERKVATNITPRIFLNEFAMLQVADVTDVGAFMDWGMEKELMVPFKEQRAKMEEGRWYVVYMSLDEKTDRLYASNRLDRFLQNDELTVNLNDEVEVIILQKSDLGYSVAINNLHKGLIYKNEVFQKLNVGDKLTGYVKVIREDQKIDISLQPIGYDKFNDPNCEMIIDRLKDEKGFLSLSDKSTPEEIYEEFSISKKAFKKALGALYKQRTIEIKDNGIQIIVANN